MRLRACFLILIGILLLSLVCSCKRETANGKEGKDVTDDITATDTEAMKTDEVTDTAEEITEEVSDTVPDLTAEQENNITETQPVQSCPDVEITVADAPSDCYTQPEKYEICFHSDSEYARDVILTPNTELKNFRFFIYDIDKYMMDNVCEISEVLYSSDSVSADRPFVCRIWIPEFISSYGISYEDKGETVMLMFGESGLDGSVLLTDFN